ncbi:hypothetical protein EVAR_80574_1 [Eumeta japonica]|uniref:Uncharacterized protein n=1 Tax=Eumeta variegata TaxID=151549 RepID=A0A4C1TNS5_EUMVA|nr:hypothetical protein EVAR_80574_1 [Eumeta japonica]
MCDMCREFQFSLLQNLLKSFPNAATKLESTVGVYSVLDEGCGSLYPAPSSPLEAKPSRAQLASDLLQQLDNQCKQVYAGVRWGARGDSGRSRTAALKARRTSSARDVACTRRFVRQSLVSRSASPSPLPSPLQVSDRCARAPPLTRDHKRYREDVLRARALGPRPMSAADAPFVRR